MTVYANGAEPQQSAYVVLTPEGRPWAGRAFGTRQEAHDAITGSGEAGHYWSRLERQGFRIVPATIRWGN